jgi:hypothetical protein
MVDTQLIATELRARGYKVDQIVPIPSNAGEYEFRVDDVNITLAEARALLESPVDHERLTLRPNPMEKEE